MRRFIVRWRIPYGGSYIPEDSCTYGGGYNSDKYGQDLIPASDRDEIKSIIRQMYGSNVRIQNIKLVNEDKV